MRKTLLVQSALSAAMLTFAGTALAADPAQPGRADGVRNEAPAEIDRTRNTDINTPGMPNDAAKPTAPPNSIVGLNVVNAEGEEIGEVAGVDGSKVIVSVGGFLGLGAHDVALEWDELEMTGNGADAKLQTAMTKEQLKGMPQYEGSTINDRTKGTREPPSGSTRGYVPPKK